MLCDKCKKNQASIHYQQVISGVQTSMNLCSECATSGMYAAPLPFEINVSDLNNFIASIFNLSGGEKQVLKCPECGYTIDRFNETSLLGCEKCYDTFKEELLPVIKNIQGTTQASAGNAPVKEQENTLRAQLLAAVEREDYEQAAVLRDQIKAVEKSENT